MPVTHTKQAVAAQDITWISHTKASCGSTEAVVPPTTFPFSFQEKAQLHTHTHLICCGTPTLVRNNPATVVQKTQFLEAMLF